MARQNVREGPDGVRHAVKLDQNHAPIVAALRKVGAEVIELARYGLSPDVLCLFRGRMILLEIKVPGGSLEESQRKLLDAGWPLVVVRSIDEALDAIGAVRYGRGGT